MIPLRLRAPGPKRYPKAEGLLNALGVLVLLAFPASLKGLDRPNILVIMTDDQGYGELSSHGNPVLKTPNLDRLWAQSVRFTDFHVSPTCAPTRAALLTGQHEFRVGVTHTVFERERPERTALLLPQVLRSAGYRTGIFGKWHLGDEAAYQPDQRGFQEVFIHGGGGIGQTYPGSCGDVPGNTYRDPAVCHNGRFVKSQGYCTDVFVDAALRWMKGSSDPGKPFFAYLTPNAPHAPLVSPGPEWEAPYQGQGLSPLTIRYYAMIAHFDAALGRVLDWLQESGHERDTLVIFLTDNGHSLSDAYNAGMRGMKATPYQGGTRVPSLWRWTGTLPAGVDVPVLTAHLDVLPTLAELAQAHPPAQVRRAWEGRSLLPLLRNARAAWPNRYLFTHVGRWEAGQMDGHQWKNCSVRDERFRLVNGAELYDLKNDPAETRNVATAYPDVVARMRRVYAGWWEGIRQPALANEWIIGPRWNPYAERYWAQEGGQPDAQLGNRMDPAYKFDPLRPPM